MAILDTIIKNHCMYTISLILKTPIPKKKAITYQYIYVYIYNSRIPIK